TINVTNECGWIWQNVPVELDTAGVGVCEPPQIIGISSNAPVCAGDTLLLFAEVAASGPCLSYQWSGTNVIQSGNDTTYAVAPGGNNYALTLVNACGSSSMTVQPAIVSQQNLSAVLCSPIGTMSLDSLANIPLPPGSWSFAGEPHSGFYDPLIDTSGHYYYYHNPLGCSVVRLNVMEFAASYAGQDTAITVCSTIEPFSLFDLLGEGVMLGGYWSFGMAG